MLKEERIGRKYGIITLIVLVLVVVVASLVMCQPRNMPQQPLTLLVLEEVPNASYMRFMVEGGVEGEAVFTHELRTPGGEILATRVYTVAMAGVYTDTVAPPLECLAWGVAIIDTAEIWARGQLYIEPPLGIVSAALNGIGYSDLGTLITDVDVRGFYKMGTLRVYKLYFPIVFR